MGVKLGLLTLNEERSESVWDQDAKIFEPRRDKIIESRKLHYEELRNFRSSPNIVIIFNPVAHLYLKILSRVRGSMTNNNGSRIEWLDLLVLL
jgi:hypothetical protein